MKDNRNFWHKEWMIARKNGEKQWADACKDKYRETIKEALQEEPSRFYIENLKTLPTIHLNRLKMKNYIPFSNGTEAMNWYENNCENCVKAYFPKEDRDYPNDKTMKKYIKSGKECKLKYAIDFGFVSGDIPDEVAILIGKRGEMGLKDSCMLFSDNDDDGYKPPEPPEPPDNTPENQLVMPFEVNRILETESLKVLETTN